MIRKRDTCLYCGEEMESKTAKKKFCSDKCKVYWHRENPKIHLKNFNKKSAIITKSENIDAVNKKMPSGLDKGATLRWLRENG